MSVTAFLFHEEMTAFEKTGKSLKKASEFLSLS